MSPTSNVYYVKCSETRYLRETQLDVQNGEYFVLKCFRQETNWIQWLCNYAQYATRQCNTMCQQCFVDNNCVNLLSVLQQTQSMSSLQLPPSSANNFTLYSSSILKREYIFCNSMVNSVRHILQAITMPGYRIFRWVQCVAFPLAFPFPTKKRHQ